MPKGQPGRGDASSTESMTLRWVPSGKKWSEPLPKPPPKGRRFIKGGTSSVRQVRRRSRGPELAPEVLRVATSSALSPTKWPSSFDLRSMGFTPPACPPLFKREDAASSSDEGASIYFVDGCLTNLPLYIYRGIQSII